MITGLLSFSIIVGRAYFYFQDQISSVIALDVLALLLFTCLVIIRKENIYAGIVTFLPSVSLYLFMQNKPISDLLFVSFLLTTYVLFHGKRSLLIRKERATLYFFELYLLLLIAYLFSNYLNLYLDLHLQPVFMRFLNYLVLTLYASFAFLMVYREEDNVILSNAFIVAAFSYMAASTLGYFYIEKIDIADFADDITKELFRYPGFSNSNYIGNAIVMLVAIAYSLNKNRMYLYLPLVILTAVLSQSRSVFFSSMIFLSYCAAQGLKKHQMNSKLIAKYSVVIIIIATLLFLISQADDKLLNIAAQYIDRVTMQSAMENISERLDLVRSAVHDSTDGFKNILFGVGYIQDGANPHNSVVQALLLFGIMPTLVVVSYFIYVSWKLPIVIFALFASFAEILFFTYSYDFLFFILLVVNVYNSSGQGKQHVSHT